MEDIFNFLNTVLISISNNALNFLAIYLFFLIAGGPYKVYTLTFIGKTVADANSSSYLIFIDSKGKPYHFHRYLEVLCDDLKQGDICEIALPSWRNFLGSSSYTHFQLVKLVNKSKEERDLFFEPKALEHFDKKIELSQNFEHSTVSAKVKKNVHS